MRVPRSDSTVLSRPLPSSPLPFPEKVGSQLQDGRLTRYLTVSKWPPWTPSITSLCSRMESGTGSLFFGKRRTRQQISSSNRLPFRSARPEPAIPPPPRETKEGSQWEYFLSLGVERQAREKGRYACGSAPAGSTRGPRTILSFILPSCRMNSPSLAHHRSYLLCAGETRSFLIRH